MKKLLSVAAILMLLVFFLGVLPVAANTITVSWDTTTAEDDVQYYQLYVGDTDTTLVKFGDLIPFNPLQPDTPVEMSTNYEIVVPAGQVVTKWFSVTAIDTSGNESALATPVSVTVDAQPPSAPTGLSVTINIVIE